MGDNIIVKALKLHVENFCHSNEPGGCPKKDDCDGISPGSTRNKNQQCPHYIFRAALDDMAEYVLMPREDVHALLRSNRPQLTLDELDKAVVRIQEKMLFRVNQKGMGAYSSRHEVLGIVKEEFKELVDAVHTESNERVSEELLDLAVGCVLGMASIDSGKTDW